MQKTKEGKGHKRQKPQKILMYLNICLLNAEKKSFIYVTLQLIENTLNYLCIIEEAVGKLTKEANWINGMSYTKK